jgi:hypothetical protein
MIEINLDTMKEIDYGRDNVPTPNNISNNVIIKRIIREKKLRIPYDLDMNVISELSSTIEPNFLKEIISEYPEYFI